MEQVAFFPRLDVWDEGLRQAEGCGKHIFAFLTHYRQFVLNLRMFLNNNEYFKTYIFFLFWATSSMHL